MEFIEPSDGGRKTMKKINYKIKELSFKLLNRKKLSQLKDWKGQPYNLIEVKGWRTGIFESNGGQRTTISFVYQFDRLFDKTINNFYKFRKK